MAINFDTDELALILGNALFALRMVVPGAN